MKAVPSRDNMPKILILVVMEAIIFLSTSMLDIIMLMINMENHYGRYRLPSALPMMNKRMPENSVS